MKMCAPHCSWECAPTGASRRPTDLFTRCKHGDTPGDLAAARRLRSDDARRGCRFLQAPAHVWGIHALSTAGGGLSRLSHNARCISAYPRSLRVPGSTIAPAASHRPPRLVITSRAAGICGRVAWGSVGHTLALYAVWYER